MSEHFEEFNGIEKDKKRASRRKLDMSKASRKRDISHAVYGIDWYDNLHEYSKNKVHCSCQMCRFRSKWLPNEEPIQDIKNKNVMELKEKEYNGKIRIVEKRGFQAHSISDKNDEVYHQNKVESE